MLHGRRLEFTQSQTRAEPQTWVELYSFSGIQSSWVVTQHCLWGSNFSIFFKIQIFLPAASDADQLIGQLRRPCYPRTQEIKHGLFLRFIALADRLSDPNPIWNCSSTWKQLHQSLAIEYVTEIKKAIQRGTKRYVNLGNRTQARPGRAVKKEQEQNSRNHVQAFLLVSVYNRVLIA